MFENSRWYSRALAGLFVSLAAAAFGGTFVENFNSAPNAAGWRVHGNTNLFEWDTTNGNLRVTWDSSQPNSYYYRPLGTVLGRNDDFTLAFDLRLADIATATKSGPFEIAVGLLNLSDATRSEFWRGTGINALHGPRNIVEFDYFPAGYYSGWGDVEPSISPTLISGDNHFASAFSLIELTNGAVFQVALEFTASNQTLRTTLKCNGATFAPVDDAVLGTNFTDFRLDTLAIASYSDTGNDFDSVLAHGTVDNVVVTTPPPPVSAITGRINAGTWQVELLSRTNWIYTLERTQDFRTWFPAADSAIGNNGILVLEDRLPLATNALYRVRAERP